MNDTLMDIENTLKLEKKKYRSLLSPTFGTNSTMYNFTTENLSGYLVEFDVKGKNVLTVTSSGDQLINLCLLGASNVDCFDSNRNAYYMTSLKIAAIKALSYEEFLTYFSSCEREGVEKISSDGILGTIDMPVEFGKNPNYLSFELYTKIRPFLDSNSSLFFDKLYEEFKKQGMQLKESKEIFHKSSKQSAIKNNLYLANEFNYYLVRQKIDNIKYNFYTLDIFEIDKLPSKYDVVMLSNIYDYITKVEDIGDVSENKKRFERLGIPYQPVEYSEINSDIDFIDLLNNKLKSILNPGAKIIGAYKYHYEDINNDEVTFFTGAFRLRKYKLVNSGKENVVKVKLSENSKKFLERKSEYIRKKNAIEEECFGTSYSSDITAILDRLRKKDKGIINGMKVVTFPSSTIYDDNDEVIVFDTKK